MMASLSGKSVLITGGAGVIGQAFAKKCLSLGSKVLICDVNAEAGNKAAESFAAEFGPENVKFVLCDVTCDKSFKGAFETCKESFGGVDVVINNAGFPDQKLKLSLDVNLGGVMRGSELGLQYMSKMNGHDGGRIINIGSIGGLKNIPFCPFYTATKSGVIHYSRAIGHDFHYLASGVAVQCLCPSFVDTPFLELILNTQTTSYDERSFEATKDLMGKVPRLQPSDVVDALVKLITENKSGAVMVLEVTANGKETYLVEPSIPS